MNNNSHSIPSLAFKQSNRWYISRICNHLKYDPFECMILRLEPIAVIVNIQRLGLFFHVLLSKLLGYGTELGLRRNHLAVLAVNLEEILRVLLFHTLFRQAWVWLDLLLILDWRGQLMLLILVLSCQVWIVFLFILLLAASWWLYLGLVILFIHVLSILFWITLFLNECWLVCYNRIVLHLLRMSW